jgi:hypothetical protein
VRGARIGDHVAEIAQHLDDSDADPVAEFGMPGELAARLAEDEERIPAWMRSFLVRLATTSLATDLNLRRAIKSALHPALSPQPVDRFGEPRSRLMCLRETV